VSEGLRSSIAAKTGHTKFLDPPVRCRMEGRKTGRRPGGEKPGGRDDVWPSNVGSSRDATQRSSYRCSDSSCPSIVEEFQLRKSSDSSIQSCMCALSSPGGEEHVARMPGADPR
jgi:hypothetical protein